MSNYKAPHSVEMKDFNELVAEYLMARGSGKTLKVLVNIKSNETMYMVEDAKGVVSLWETPREAIKKYNSAYANVKDPAYGVVIQ